MEQEEGRITAVFHPQRWDGKYAVPAGDVVKVDVTVQVLLLGLSAIHGLKDDDIDTDGLVNADTLGHHGPFWVEVQEAICRFFGVDDLTAITQAQLMTARIKWQRHHPEVAAIPVPQETVGVLDIDMAQYFDYDAPDEVPEWEWIQRNASFNHVGNGTEGGVWEFMVHGGKKQVKDVPNTLRPFFEAAQQRNCPWLMFHQ